MSLKGVDLYHNNPIPNLDPYDFVFLKCTQGSSFADPAYSERSIKVRGLGKVLGAYHFGTMTDSVVAQVQNFELHSNIRSGDIVIYDFENDGTWGSHTIAQIAAVGLAVIKQLNDFYPNNRIVLYCNISTYQTIVVPNKMLTNTDGLWIAAPGTTPPVIRYLFWQYGQINIDLDQESTFETLAELKAWTIMTEPTGVTLNKATLDAIALACAGYSNPAQPNDPDMHQHASDATQALTVVQGLTTTVHGLVDMVNTLQSAVNKLSDIGTPTSPGAPMTGGSFEGTWTATPPVA